MTGITTISDEPTGKIVIAGGSGALGNLLVDAYLAKGWKVVVLSRLDKHFVNGVRYVKWDGRTMTEWVNELEGAKAVVNLAGRNINTRFNAKNRREILDSRTQSTVVIGDAILRCQQPPTVWVNAGGVSIYASSPLSRDERDPPDGAHFLADVSKAWEDAFAQALVGRTRKVQLRISSVLQENHGLLAPLVKLTRIGLGGPIGPGNQYLSWIHAQDFVKLIIWLVDGSDFAGLVHACSPNPVTNKDFLLTLRRRLGIKIGIPAPTWAAKFGALLIGTEPELALANHRVVSHVLATNGFQFDFPELGNALDNLML